MGGSIHCNENIAYSMKEMGAGIEVIKILKEGYSLPFTRLPGQYREKNNHSAKRHAVALSGKMLEWEGTGHSTRIKNGQFCCNPMTVAEKS